MYGLLCFSVCMTCPLRAAWLMPCVCGPQPRTSLASVRLFLPLRTTARTYYVCMSGVCHVCAPQPRTALASPHVGARGDCRTAAASRVWRLRCVHVVPYVHTAPCLAPSQPLLVSVTEICVDSIPSQPLLVAFTDVLIIGFDLPLDLSQACIIPRELKVSLGLLLKVMASALGPSDQCLRIQNQYLFNG